MGRAILLALLLLLPAGCKDKCEGLSPQAEVAYQLGSGLSAGKVHQIRVEASLGAGSKKKKTLGRSEAGLDKGDHRITIVFDGTSISGETDLAVELVALDDKSKPLGTGKASTKLSADGCNFISLTIGSTSADGGVDGSTDGTTPGTVIDLSKGGADLEISDDDPQGPVAVCDFNGDKKQDLIVATPTAPGEFTGSQPNFGKIYVLLGPTFGSPGGKSSFALDDAVVAMWIAGKEAGDRLGDTLLCADLNADGYDDLAFGAPELDGKGSNDGKVYVVYGTKTLANINLFKGDKVDLEITAGIDVRLGAALAPVGGLVKGSAYLSLAIGAPEQGGGAGKAQGAVFILLGAAKWPATVDLTSSTSSVVTLLGGTQGEQLGTVLAAGGLTSRSGADKATQDLVAGGPGANPVGSKVGAVRVLRGRTFAGGESFDCAKKEHSLSVWGLKEGTKFAESLAVGDVDADGVEDLLIGAANHGDTKKTGAVYLLLGDGGFTLPAATAKAEEKNVTGYYKAVFQGSAMDGQFGASIFPLRRSSTSTEVDLLVAAPSANGLRGATYLIAGRSSYSLKEPIEVLKSKDLLLEIRGASALDRLGYLVGGGVMSAKNARSDLVLCAPGAKKVYAIFR